MAIRVQVPGVVMLMGQAQSLEGVLYAAVLDEEIELGEPPSTMAELEATRKVPGSQLKSGSN